MPIRHGSSRWIHFIPSYLAFSFTCHITSQFPVKYHRRLSINYKEYVHPKTKSPYFTQDVPIVKTEVVGHGCITVRSVTFPSDISYTHGVSFSQIDKACYPYCDCSQPYLVDSSFLCTQDLPGMQVLLTAFKQQVFLTDISSGYITLLHSAVISIPYILSIR